MAKKKKKKGGGPASDAWLVTFGDLVTLLLTFFVLLLSMASMDKSILTKIVVYRDDLGMLSVRSAGMIPPRVRMVIPLLERPWEILDKQKRIKDMLFPEDKLPKDLSRSTLEENLRVLARPEGVALVLSEELLFQPGQSRLSQRARILLDEIITLLNYMPAPVNVSGYTDMLGYAGDQTAYSARNFALAGDRALAVLEYFTQQGLPDKRFSISGYGPYWAIAENDTAAGRAQNRRVEILLKTTPWLGAYVQ